MNSSKGWRFATRDQLRKTDDDACAKTFVIKIPHVPGPLYGIIINSGVASLRVR